MGVLLEWINGRGFVNSDHIVSVKCHEKAGQIKLYARDVRGDEHLLRNPLNTNEFQYKLGWEKEARKQILALMKLIQGGESNLEPLPSTKKTIERKAK